MPDISAEILHRRIFTEQDQARFASFSGDSNPMHMDALAARRTQAGAPVVHGVHLLLWALDQYAARHPMPGAPVSLQARFDKFCYVGDSAETLLVEASPSSVRLDIRIDGQPIAAVQIGLGALCAAAPTLPEAPLQPVPAAACDLALEQMRDACGRLAFASGDAAAAAMFPHAAQWLGARRVASLACSTALVGMVCPGLHSIYGRLKLNVCETQGHALFYRVVSINDRFRMIRLAVAGGGLEGTLECFARLPPQAQRAMSALAGTIDPAAFQGHFALIIGGSRGLGELTAKLVATGGGKVAITYQRGRADAEAVAEDINAAGGACSILPYDASLPAAPQLAGLTVPPSHSYYFATPPIFRRPTMFFEPARLDSFLAIYVQGFWNLSSALRETRSDIALFYPSSVAVTERPPGMTEYAMAKAAGEALCADINAALAPMRVVVERLPRLPTDQTASITAIETADPLETMLPIIRRMHA
jgi:hypothetical protein